MEIEYKGISYTIEKEQYEVDDIFFKRAWFVVKQQATTQIDLEKAIYNSKLWSNMKFLGCTYNDSIKSEIIKLEREINNYCEDHD